MSRTGRSEIEGEDRGGGGGGENRRGGRKREGTERKKGRSEAREGENEGKEGNKNRKTRTKPDDFNTASQRNTRELNEISRRTRQEFGKVAQL